MSTTRYSTGWTDPRGIYGSGVQPRWDIRSGMAANMFPEIDKTNYKDLANLWIVKFGVDNVSYSRLINEPDEWRYIAFILFKRGKIIEWADGQRAVENDKFYRLKDE